MSPFRVVLLYLAWGLLWTAVQTYVISSIGFDLRLAFIDALTTNLVLVALGYAMAVALRFYLPGVRQLVYLMGWSMGLAGICVLLIDVKLEFLLTEETAYLAFVDLTLPVRIAFAWLMILFVVSQNWIWFYIKEKQEGENRKHATEKMAREAELFTLRQQLQPHFLFNSLNSISALVNTRPEQARKMVQQLSDFLRGTLRKDDQPLVPLADELQHLQIYLEIEKVRFGHRLQTEIDAEPQCLPLLVPYLLLQPLVENAIKFGLYDTLGDTLIKITAQVQEGLLVITTQNPFEAASFQQKQGTGFGLESVRRRLYLLYARHDLLTTQQREQTFVTTVKIPQKL